MARSQLTRFVACLAFTSALALQVTPNSQCASVCMDDVSQDRSDPNVSNTVGADIVCRDQNYASPVGQKFKKCVECLQNSSDKSTAESDLQWFFYNIRFAIASCIYGRAPPTDPLSSPCAIQTSCGPLIGAVQDGMDEPTNSNIYSYCSAFGNSFLGPRLAPCTKCLRLTDEQKYMSNFLVALKAGCDQKPEIGKSIGLDGSLFSSIPVNITSAAAVPPASSSESRSGGGLTTGAYAGIGVAGAFVIAIFAAACYIGRKKKLARQHRDQLASGLDDRWGNGRITVPVKGAYGDPYGPKSSPYQVGFAGHGNVEKPDPYYNNSQPLEEYLPGRHRPLSQISQHTAHNIGRGGNQAPFATYDPTRGHSPIPAYSPALSHQTSDTPTHSPNSIANSVTRLHKPTKSTDTSRTRGLSLTITDSAHQVSGAAPMVGSGLPRPPPPLPKRSDDTEGSSYNSRPTRATRDLSQARDNASSISGPIVTVNGRFDTEDEAKKKADRQRLYQLGIKTPPKEEEPKSRSPDDGAWPGNY